MEKVCPECNKLSFYNLICSICGNNMVDVGRAQEIFQDDYTANMPINDSTDYCVHVFLCKNCGSSQSIRINKIDI